jgi:hypothetical protein
MQQHIVGGTSWTAEQWKSSTKWANGFMYRYSIRKQKYRLAEWWTSRFVDESGSMVDDTPNSECFSEFLSFSGSFAEIQISIWQLKRSLNSQCGKCATIHIEATFQRRKYKNKHNMLTKMASYWSTPRTKAENKPGRSQKAKSHVFHIQHSKYVEWPVIWIANTDTARPDAVPLDPSHHPCAIRPASPGIGREAPENNPESVRCRVGRRSEIGSVLADKNLTDVWLFNRNLAMCCYADFSLGQQWNPSPRKLCETATKDGYGSC